MALTKPKGSIIDLSSGDKVGIGTTSPGATLEIKNKSYSEGQTENSNLILKDSTGNNTITLTSNVNGANLKMQVGASGNLFVMDYYGSSGDEVLALNVGGNSVFEMGHNGYVNFGEPGNTSLVKNVTITDTNDVRLYLESTSVSSGTTLGKLSWCGAESQSTENARIEAIAQGAVNAGQLQFRTRSSSTSSGENNTPVRMVIDPSGNVGIGTTTPTLGKLQVHGSKYVVTNSGKALGGIHVSPDTGAALNEFGGAISFSAGGNGSSAIAAVNTTGSDNDSMGLAFFTHGSSTGSADATERMRIDANGVVDIKSGGSAATPSLIFEGDTDTGFFHGTDTLAISTAGSERMRINSSGALLVGTTTHTNNSSGSETVAEFVYDHYQRGVEIRSTVGGNNQPFLGFRYGGGPTDCGGIRRDGNNQTPEFFSGSDKRIKTNIQDMDSTLSKICQMPLVKYDLKDGSGSGVGVLAQDLIDIFPEKVTTTDDGKGETLPEGVEAWTVGHNYTYQILKAIQEQQELIETQQTTINDLKSRIEALEG